MAKNELFRYFVAHIADIESLFFFADFRIKNHVQQQIAQFFFDFFVIVVEDGLAEFVGFLDGVGTQAFVGLNAVPRAFHTQLVHNIEQSSESL